MTVREAYLSTGSNKKPRRLRLRNYVRALFAKRAVAQSRYRVRHRTRGESILALTPPLYASKETDYFAIFHSQDVCRQCAYSFFFLRHFFPPNHRVICAQNIDLQNKLPRITQVFHLSAADAAARASLYSYRALCGLVTFTTPARSRIDSQSSKNSDTRSFARS